MTPLKNGNNSDNCSGDIIHGQPISKQISYRLYKRIASFNGCFLKEDFLDWLLDLEDLFDYENICYGRKVELTLYKLSKYALCWWERVQSDRIRQGKDKIRSWPRIKRCLLSNFIIWIVKKSCRIQYKIIIGQEVHTLVILNSQIFHH